MDVLEADGVEEGGMRGDVDVEAGLGHSFLSLEYGMDMSGGKVLAGWLVWVVWLFWWLIGLGWCRQGGIIRVWGGWQT